MQRPSLVNPAVVFRLELRQKLNYRPHCSSSGAAGFQLLCRYRPSLLLPDVLHHAWWLFAEEGASYLEEWK